MYRENKGILLNANNSATNGSRRKTRQFCKRGSSSLNLQRALGVEGFGGCGFRVLGFRVGQKQGVWTLQPRNSALVFRHFRDLKKCP